jgi:uncharacterized membrane protein YdjX (TVP38/TMEM64 family)
LTRHAGGGQADPRILPRRVCLSTIPSYRADIPFRLVNVVPALCGIGVATFVAATAIGILPATFAFFGSDLHTAIEAEEAAFRAYRAAGEDGCSLHFDLTTAATPKLIAAFVALGIVMRVLIAIKRLRANVMDFN